MSEDDVLNGVDAVIVTYTHFTGMMQHRNSFLKTAILLSISLMQTLFAG